MNTTDLATDVTVSQIKEAAIVARRDNINFDGYAYLTLIGDLGQSHEDALKFAQAFRLQPIYHMKGGDLEADMDEQQLTLAFRRKCVTTDELIELSTILADEEKDLDALNVPATYNYYLSQRCNGYGHEFVMRRVPTWR